MLAEKASVVSKVLPGGPHPGTDGRSLRNVPWHAGFEGPLQIDARAPPHAERYPPSRLTFHPRAAAKRTRNSANAMVLRTVRTA
jgi:hypothetical protein